MVQTCQRHRIRGPTSLRLTRLRSERDPDLYVYDPYFERKDPNDATVPRPGPDVESGKDDTNVLSSSSGYRISFVSVFDLSLSGHLRRTRGSRLVRTTVEYVKG